MKVVHLEAGTHLYGGALQVLLLGEGLARWGVEGLLVAPEGSAILGEARSRKLPARGIPMEGELDLPFLPRFRRLLRAEKPDLVHLHSRRGADTLGALAARWAGVPVVLSRRVDNPEPPWAVRGKYRLYDQVITISEAIRRVLVGQGVPEAEVHCVHSAIEPGAYQRPCDREAFRILFGLPPGVPVVGMAAQFIARKGHRVLLAALPAVLREHPDVRFLLLGEGPLKGEVEGQIHRAGLEGSVLLPGYRPDLPDFLACLDVLVHPATMEGLGVILLQAGAAGVPVVASSVGGIPEAVGDGETGILVPPGDSSALADALLSLLSDPERRRRMAKAGRERIRTRFSPEVMVEGNLAVYRKVLASSG